jgi:hypothetical protein
MRRVMNALVAAAVVVTFSSVVLAQSTAPSAKKPVEKKTSALSASGTVARFDESAKTLTVATKEGHKEFSLAADAKIMAGASTVTSADLPGKTVKVTYSTVNGRNVASKVTIAGAKTAAPPVKAVTKR